MNEIDIPAIRGVIGKLTYYTATFTFKQIAERVKRADEELHTSKSLREQLQRALTDNHKSITEYILTQKEHFFNALVLAVYDGDPTWNELEFEFNNIRYHSMGFLHLTGEERIFPVDGQHRVEGIKSALIENSKLEDETISVIFIGHHNTREGKEKTRRIFSTLNRYAKPVSPGDNIALDEDDIVAISTRELLENCPLFMNDNVKIDKKNSKALADNDDKSFTSLITLYETNKIIYSYYKSNRDKRKKLYSNPNIQGFLRFRPKQEEIDDFYTYLLTFWETFTELFPGVKDYVLSSKDTKAAANFRNKDIGGLLYFRPVALPKLIKAIFETQLRLQSDLSEIMFIFSQIEMCISNEPWTNLLWNTKTQTMVMKYKNNITLMLIYLFKKDILITKEIDTLVKNYAEANDCDIDVAKQKLVNMQSKL